MNDEKDPIIISNKKSYDGYEIVPNGKPKKHRAFVFMFSFTLIQFATELSYSFSTMDYFGVDFVNNTKLNTDYQELLYFVIRGIIGPILGFIVQFICGTISDDYELPFGRRKFFILIGGIVWTIGRIIAVCSSIYPISLRWKEVFSSERSDLIASEVFYIIGYLLYTIGINMIQVSYRAFILDTFDNQFQTQVWTINSLNCQLSRFACYSIKNVISFVMRETEILDSKRIAIVNICLEVIPLTVIPLIVGIFCWKVKEQPYLSDKPSLKEYLKNIKQSFETTNLSHFCIWIVLFFSWLAYYAFEGTTIERYYGFLFEGCGHSETQFIQLLHMLFGVIISVTVAIIS